MGSCLKCINCNKISGLFICEKTGRPVEMNDWCSYYVYPFSEAMLKTERLMPKRDRFTLSNDKY